MARSPDRRPVNRAALIEAWRASLVRLRRVARGPARARVPDGLLFAPQDLRSADPEVAAEMAAGIYTFGDRVLSVPGASPFSVHPPDAAWNEDLYGFGWLRHLRAADTEEARGLARALVLDGLVRSRRDFHRAPAAAVRVAARRLLSFLAHSPLLLPGADSTFYGHYLERVGRDTAQLYRAMEDAPGPLDRLLAAIAVSVAGLSCSGLERTLRRATLVLSAELDGQILADGGHLGRNPASLLEILLDLLPLRLLYATRATETPPAVEGAIARAMPMLRFFRMGDGDLAHFNGAGRTASSELAAVLAQGDPHVTSSLRAAVSGYDRLRCGDTVVLVDTGAVPPLPASSAAAAGCLSFEMSSGVERLIVNGGAPDFPGPGTDAARLTGAHSTLVLGGESSARPLTSRAVGGESWETRFLRRRFGPVLLDGPRSVGAERGLNGARDLVLVAHHDGYREGFGAVHERRLRLAADGNELEGEDRIVYEAYAPDTSRPAVLRFHLHPQVAAGIEEASGAVLLETRSGTRWRFGVKGSRARLESSAVYAAAEGRRPTRQIVVDMPPVGVDRRSTCRWIFLRA